MLNIEFVQFPVVPHFFPALKSILSLFFASFAGLCPEEVVVWHPVSESTETELLVETSTLHNTVSICQAGLPFYGSNFGCGFFTARAGKETILWSCQGCKDHTLSYSSCDTPVTF